MNNKIMKHLAGKSSKKSNKTDQAILVWLGMEDHKNVIWEPLYITHDMPKIKGGSLYGSIYRLASQGKIGFASRDYHDFSATEELSRERTKVRVFLWHKDHPVDLRILEHWKDDDRDVAATVSDEQTLFNQPPQTPEEIIESADVDDLQTLIDLAKKRQIQIGIDRRYACLSKAHRDLLVGVFSGIGITDPVYFAHSNDDISFLTYTAVPDMPIDVVIDEGNGPRHISAKHLTLFGERLITYTDSMFSGGNE